MPTIKKLTAAVVGVMSGLYLLNIGAGIVEFGPDNLPVVGNLDEIIATILLLRSLTYLGVDTQRWLGAHRTLSQLGGIASAILNKDKPDSSQH